MRSDSLWTLVSFAFVLATGPAAPAQDEERRPIRIAVAGPMSGGGAVFGTSMRQGVELKVDEANDDDYGRSPAFPESVDSTSTPGTSRRRPAGS